MISKDTKTTSTLLSFRGDPAKVIFYLSDQVKSQEESPKYDLGSVDKVRALLNSEDITPTKYIVETVNGIPFNISIDTILVYPASSYGGPVYAKGTTAMCTMNMGPYDKKVGEGKAREALSLAKVTNIAVVAKSIATPAVKASSSESMVELYIGGDYLGKYPKSVLPKNPEDSSSLKL